MRFRGRVERLGKRLRAEDPDVGPLTLFPVEAGTGRAVGVRIVWDGRAQEIAFDPTQGRPALPPGGPHKLILGPEFDV